MQICQELDTTIFLNVRSDRQQGSTRLKCSTCMLQRGPRFAEIQGAASQALGCEALELLNCMHDHNPGVLASFTAVINKGWDVPNAGYRGMQGPWQHVLVSCNMAHAHGACQQTFWEKLQAPRAGTPPKQAAGHAGPLAACAVNY